MLNVIFWLIFGALIGWIGAILISASAEHTPRIVLTGVLGALIGGTCAQFVGSGELLLSRPDPTSIVGAVTGAIVLLALVHMLTNQPAPH